MYPRLEEERVKYWLTQIDYARGKIRSLFDACDILVKQYFNEPASDREMMASGSGLSNDEHIRRTKAGIVYGWIDQSLANMLDRSPIFRCYPETKEASARVDPLDPNSPTFAQGVSRIANYRYRETNQLRVDERIALDAFLFPYGVAKIGYTLDTARLEQELSQPGVELEFESAEDENLFLATGQDVRVTELQDHVGHIEIHKELLTFEPEGGQSVSDVQVILDHIDIHSKFYNRPDPAANTNIRFDAPFAVRWPPDMFLTDTLSMESVQDARWVAFGFELPLDEVQANPAWKNTRDLKPSRWRDAPEKREDLSSDGFDMVRGWEIWAKNFPVGRGKFRDLLTVVVEDSDVFLQYEEEWPYENIDDYPGETLVFQTGIRRWFHKPPLLMGGGDTVQALHNEVLDSILSTIRKQKNILLIDPASGIDARVVQDILDAPADSVIMVDGLMDMTKGEGRPIMVLPFLEIPSDKKEMIQILQQVFDRSVGTPQPVQLPSTDTATEASILERRNTARENRRSALLSEFQVRKARKMWQLDTQYRPQKLFMLDKNADKFVTITPEMARGEYLFSMDVTSHSTALAVERSQWMDLLNLFAGLTPVMIQTFGLPPNLPELARRLLVRGFNEHVVEEILPMLEQASAKLQAGPLQEGGEILANGRGTEFSNPEAQEAQESVVEGKNSNAGIGPLDRDSFQNAPAKEGKLAGDALNV